MLNFQNISSVILVFILIDSTSTSILSSLTLLKQRIEKLGEEKFARIFKEDELNKHYDQLYNAKLYKVVPVNESKIAERFSKQLEDELRKKMEALKRTVEYAEDQAKKYKWNSTLAALDVSYINSKMLEPNDSSLTGHPMFKTKVVLNKSSVHIPTEIYDGDPNILNTIKWSSSLTKSFVRNANILRYQYFASSTGIVVQFPGMMWRNKKLDMYDVRRRPWFAQGASSPKDIMILIDTSGSMTGISIAITKIAVKKVIDTLGENDYVAVAQFPGRLKETANFKISYPHLLMNITDCKTECAHECQNECKKTKDSAKPCFDNFVQANKRNKKVLFEHISQLKPLGIADLGHALEFGVKQFQKMDNISRSYEGSNCNRIILVLTDGNDHYKHAEIKTLMNQSTLTRNVRIFIYTIGEEVAPMDSLLGITCDYRGFFGHIRSFGAVNNIIDKFVSVVHNHKIHEANPLGDNEFRVSVSNVASDGFLNNNDFPPQGLGLMTSLTMPVYNRSGNGSFLGLLGTDMTVDFMNHLVPRDKLGPNGYAFAINTNGYIIFHPELKVQKGWMRDPPNVDLIEIEFNSEEKTKLRADIINCAGSNGTGSGHKDVKGLIKVLDGIHTYEKIRRYAFHGIPLSTFGVTIVNPTFNKYYSEIDERIYFDKLEICDQRQCVMSITLPDKSKRNITFAKNIHIYAEDGILTGCKILEEEVLQIFDEEKSLLYTSSPMVENGSSPPILPVTGFGSSITVSIAMAGNVTGRQSPWHQISTLDNQTATSVPAIFSNHLITLLGLVGNDSSNNCSAHEIRRLIVDLIILESLVNSLDIMALEKSIKSITVAMVSGITLVYPESEKQVYRDLFHSFWNSSIFQRAFDTNKLIFYTPLHRNGPTSHNDVMIFKAFSPDHSNQLIPGAVLGITLNQSSMIDVLQSSDGCNDNRICYLLEDAGYIVSVSDPSMSDGIGYFFGDKHVHVMTALLNDSVFLSVEEFNYQASCPRQKEADAAASSSHTIEIVTKLPIKVLQILMNSGATILSMIRLTIQLLLIGVGHAQEATASNNENVTCIHKTYRYYLPDNVDHSKLVDVSCNDCNFTVATLRFEKTNTILVSFDRNCSIPCQQTNVKPIPTLPVQDPGPDVCEQSKQPNYRMRPEYKCYSFDPNEDFTRCSALALRVSILFTIVIFTSLLIAFN